jgi:hypothetical protein
VNELFFLALFGELLFAFFGFKQYVVRIKQVLFPALPCFAVFVPVVKFKLMQMLKKFLVEFGLQLLGKTGKQLCRFGSKQSGFLEGVKVLYHASKGSVEVGQGFVNTSLVGKIEDSHVRLFAGEFWSGLLSCLNTIAARMRYSTEKAKAFKLGHYRESIMRAMQSI